jgi:hypothetical protein
MNYMSRILSGFFVMTSLLLSFASFSAEWLFERGPITDQFGNRVSLLDLQRRDEQISREIQLSIDQVKSKDTVAAALHRGEITLIDAAVMFRSLYEDPYAWHHPQRPRPARGDGAVWCREVIDWIDTKVRMEQSPSQAEAVRQRLEAELQRELAYHGLVKLPE